MLAAALLLAGCGSDTASGPEPEECPPLEDFPGLCVGSWWVYERTEWETQVPDHVFEYATTVVSADSLTAGGIAYRLVEDADDQSFWLRIVNCELRTYEEHPETARDHSVLLRTPIAAGRRWQYSTISYGGFALEAEIVSVSDTVIVPAGTFTDCIRIRIEPYYDTWVSLTDGIVAAAFTQIGGGSGWRDELLDRYLATPARGTPVLQR